MDAVAAWEWRMLSSLVILAWLKTFMRNALAAGREIRLLIGQME